MVYKRNYRSNTKVGKSGDPGTHLLLRVLVDLARVTE